MTNSSWVIGVDIGGTFTEAVALDEKGEISYSKVPTTAGELTLGVMESMRTLAASLSMPLEEILSKTIRFAHGTTQTVNAVVQKKGPKTGLITTRGFKDHFIIMRGGRGVGLSEVEKANFSMLRKPEPLVPLWLTEEVSERTDYSGRAVVALDRVDAQRGVRNLLSKGVESIAVSLLWSFKNPGSERQIRQIVEQEAPSVFVSVSSEVAPVLGEYERTATTIINSFLGPILRSYTEDLRTQLESAGFRGPILLMQSIGGLIPSCDAPKMAASTILSGLAGGIIGSSYLGRLLGYRNIINTDMGGTSFEVGIIHRGVPLVAVHPLSPRFGIYISRYHLALPMIDITAIGSGGGSIAWLDEGTLKVGPRSAGAHPGPSCYGKGGTEPTVTDADIVLGYLNSEYFLGGRMPLDPNASSEAIRNKIAIPLGIDLTEAAKGIYEVVNNQMADLIRSLTIERGYHPKDFVLFAYGGAGPMHCGSYGNALGVTKMLVPGRGFATAHSAFGVATSDLSKTFSLSDPTAEPFEAQRINRNFSNLEAKALETLATWGVAREEIILRRSVDMRYKKQTHEITIDVSSIEFGQQGVDQLIELFERNYELLFGAGTSHREAGVELITFRVDALGTVGKPSLKLHSLEGPDSGTALKAKRGAYFAEVDDFTETEIFEGSKLRAGNMIHGPAIIEYPGTTVVVHPGQTCTVDEYLNIVLEV